MTGAERAREQPEHGFEQHEATGADWLGTALTEPEDPPAPEEAAAPPRPLGIRLLGAFLAVLAIAWIAAAGWSLRASWPGLDLAALVPWIATTSAPLALLALLWVWLGRTPRREAERFSRAVREMRAESNALESVLAIVSSRIEENHARLRGEAERLMSLGDEASDRLGRVTYYLSKETANLDRQSTALDSAAAAARVDIGVLLHDLPRAEEQARAVAEAMKEAGLTAHSQASGLEAQVTALSARGREADELLGGAAQRLAAHVARIETGSAAAAASMGEASAGMTGAVDAAMERAAQAIEAARTGLDAQATAMFAAIEHSRAALDEAGEDAAGKLAERLQTIGQKMEGLAGQLAAQDAATHALVAGLSKELGELDAWFERLGDSGSAETDRLARSVAEVRDSTRALVAEVGGGRDEASALIDRGREMTGIFASVGSQLETGLPASLAAVEAQAEQAGAVLAGLAPMAAQVEASTNGIATQAATLAAQAEAISASLAAHEAGSRGLVAALLQDVDALEQRLASVAAAGGEQAEQLSGGIATLRTAAAQLAAELGSGEAQAGALGERAKALLGALHEIGNELGEQLPAALARIEADAGRSRDAAAALSPVVRDVEASAVAAAARLGEAETGIARQREALEALFARIDGGVAGADEQLRGLGRAAAEAHEAAAKIAASTGPELIEALVRVREAANQAAERARDAIASVIPASAAALGEAGREALTRAVAETVEGQLAELSLLSQRALETAQGASQRLTRQMLALGETAATIEARIDDARKEREEQESENFSRRVALLIESLNSTAIDVTKILSNEVTDSAWAAYLKGDRGVFTRRAVRLLDAAETREIARHYDEEPDFREQVNRYIHDFEAMLRRILADRDGSPLGVTILSSDMGKLYVALAQGIERLRK